MLFRSPIERGSPYRVSFLSDSRIRVIMSLGDMRRAFPSSAMVCACGYLPFGDLLGSIAADQLLPITRVFQNRARTNLVAGDACLDRRVELQPFSAPIDMDFSHAATSSDTEYPNDDAACSIRVCHSRIGCSVFISAPINTPTSAGTQGMPHKRRPYSDGRQGHPKPFPESMPSGREDHAVLGITGVCDTQSM